MNLVSKQTGKKLSGVIEDVTIDDLKQIGKSKEFGFDWGLESGNHLFKIRLLGSKTILGLMSLTDFPEEFRIHINLIESSMVHRGKKKEILNIPGCLIAFACKMAFKNGYEGFVSLTPKTQLSKYYSETYGFLQFGNQMAVVEEISESLIQKYIGNEEI